MRWLSSSAALSPGAEAVEPATDHHNAQASALRDEKDLRNVSRPDVSAYGAPMLFLELPAGAHVVATEEVGQCLHQRTPFLQQRAREPVAVLAEEGAAVLPHAADPVHHL